MVESANGFCFLLPVEGQHDFHHSSADCDFPDFHRRFFLAEEGEVLLVTPCPGTFILLPSGRWRLAWFLGLVLAFAAMATRAGWVFGAASGGTLAGIGL